MTEKLSAFLVGATGEVGKGIVQELARNKLFSRVTLFTRRNIDLTSTALNEQGDTPEFSKFDQKIIDFDKLATDPDIAKEFEGYQVGFCSLGTTRAKAGTEGFIKVDHDYVVNTAKLAKAGGCKQFHLVSSTGANKNSWFLYPRVKGQVEEEISTMGFERASIYRPSLLLCERSESRMGEGALQFVAKKIDRGGSWSIQVPLLARVIVNNCFTPVTSPVQVMENRTIQQMDVATTSTSTSTNGPTPGESQTQN